MSHCDVTLNYDLRRALGPQRDLNGYRMNIASPLTEDAGQTTPSVVGEYLDAVFGDTVGYAHVAFGRGQKISDKGKYEFDKWLPAQVPWPAQRPALIARLERASQSGEDVYVCPYLREGTERTLGSAVERRHIHADVDLNLDLNKVRNLGGFAVGSGSEGHGHVYVELAESVSLAHHRALCIGLRDYLGDADAKISDNDVLRPPGTRNFKNPTFDRGNATDTKFLIKPQGQKWPPASLAAKLGVDLDAPAPKATARKTSSGAVVPHAPDEIDPFDISSYPKVVRAIADSTGDRSTDTMKVVGACHSSGLTVAQARFAVRSRSDLAGRLDERNDDDVAECFSKAVEKSPTAPASQVQSSIVLEVSAIPDTSVCNASVWLNRTEFGVAERWGMHYLSTWRYRPNFGWFEWEGKVWALRDEIEHQQTVLSTIRAMSELEVSKITDSDLDKQREKREEMLKFAKSMETANRIKNIAALCSKLRSANPGDVWDQDPLILNTPLGVFDFRTGETMPHDPSFYCTKITAGSGDITATSEVLDKVLAGLAATDEEIPAALQKICGLGCSGLTADVFAHVFGEARTGKSSLFEGFMLALGGDGPTSYSFALDASVLEKQTIRGGDKANPSLHELIGRRFVFVDEFSKIKVDADLLKRMTGGVTITTRDLYSRNISWKPKFNLAGTGNARVNLPDDDVGLAMRLFPVKIEKRDHEVDPTVRERLFRAEGLDAVLAFAMRGLMEMLEGGKTSLGIADLKEPECVTTERGEYLKATDPLALWWEECIEELPEPMTGSTDVPTISDLVASYVAFSKARNQRFTISERALITRLKSKGHIATERTVRTTSWGYKKRGRFVESLRLFSLDGDGAMPRVTDSNRADF